MTTLAAIADVARQFLRDHGQFFEETYADISPTLRLPHPNIDPDALEVIDNAGEALTTAYVLNARVGLLKLNDPAAFTGGVTVSGLYYQWFLPDDLNFFAGIIVNEHFNNRSGSLESVPAAEVEVLGIGCLVNALWAMMTEFSTDIDVSDPEGMSLPIHQRYQQVAALVNYWTAKYDEKAAMLNVGLKRIEQFTLRRESRMTGRYVPIYRGRELDNPRPPIRVRPPIERIAPTAQDEEDEYMAQRYPEANFGTGDMGWENLGTTGGYP